MDDRVELELALAADGQGGYRVTVRSAAGEESGQLRLDPWPLLKQRPQLQSTVLASAVASRAALSEVEGPVREVGEALFRALFDEGVYAAYKASLAVAAERGTQLRVVLRMHPAELAALPWEMLYDPEAGAYLCQREPLVRHVSVAGVTRALRVAPPLRILGVVSAPRDRPRLDVEGEKQRLKAALSPLGSRVSLRWVEGGRWADVQRELVAGSWHVLHFVGHGGFDRDHREGVLILEDDQGNSDLVGAERFSDLLTLQVPPLQLVLLNSCAGGQSAAEDVFSSTAATLIRTGVSAVVAMQFAVSDPAAKAFAAGFYQAIAHNHSIAEAVRIGRIGIRGTGEETLEWITPVLYLRGDDAALFEVLPGGRDEERDDGSSLSPQAAAEEAAVQALYQQAMSRFRAQRFGEALPLFDSVLSLRSDYRDAAARRAHAAQEVRMAEAYDEATAAEQRSDWSAAAQGYAAVLAMDPERPGVRERLERSRRGQEVAALQAELREHVAAEDWPAAVSVADELRRLAPEEADPDGLATTARARLDRKKKVHRERREQEHPPPPGPSRLKVVLSAVVVVLIAGGVAWAWPGDGEDGSTDRSTQEPTDPPTEEPPPAPFRSAALYELGRHHFDARECSVPQSKEDVPLAWDLPHTELLKCERPEYTGTLICTGDETDFRTVRDAYLDKAADTPQPVTEPPAGRDEPWPFQVSFHHDPDGGGRVFWHDGGSGCLAELQTPETDIGVVLGHFVTGS
ncbi:MAG TPA: CHAT domain-containing protein [Marmoricola sp.]|nr:CHAT domain-containing protein [Marmoricola sp.]